MRLNLFDKRTNYHKTFAVNSKGKDFFVGDIHGHHSLLILQLKELKFSPENGDRLFSLGDIINRGDESEKCIELLFKSWFFCILGNHEDMLLSLVDDPDVIHSLRKVGGNWIDNYLNNPKKLTFYINLIYYKLFFAYTVETPWGDIGMVHAKAPADWQGVVHKTLSQHDETACLWSRENYSLGINNQIQNIDLVVSGHVNCKEVTSSGNQVWLDTINATGRLSILTAEQLFEVMNNGKN